MYRLLAPLPAEYSMGQLRQLTLPFFPNSIDMNIHTENGTSYFAVYVPDPVELPDVSAPPPDPTAWRAAVAAYVVTHPTPEEVEAQEQTNRATLMTQAAGAMASLQEIIDAPQPTFSNVAQAQTAVRALQTQVKTEARVLRRMLRLILNDLGGTD